MRIGIIADIHANLEAMRIVYDEIKKQSLDFIISLGDVVGYGADPNECCEIVKGIVQCNLMGNHDASINDMLDTKDFNEAAKYVIAWTKKRINPVYVSWLNSSPHTYSNDVVLFSHGSPIDPEAFDYVITKENVESIFNHFKDRYRIFFVGHAHKRFVVSRQTNSNGQLVPDNSDVIKIEKDRLYLISAGSVGQPRDHDVTTSFGILDTKKWTYNVIRLNYDIVTASDKIIKAGLPEWLAYRLTIGV